MRRVDRGKSSPAPDWFEKARQATDALVASFEQDPGKLKFDQKLYAATEVFEAFKLVFLDKCAYCDATEVVDVDHFRPKGKVQDSPDHPGYYWLVYEWSNLYPACPGCNQRRRDWGVGPARGKSSQFPLVDEGQRVHRPGPLDQEQPKLLDPCFDEPTQHFRLDPEGELTGLDERGKASIEIYHLKRDPLTKRRKEAMRTLTNAALQQNQEEVEILLAADAEFSALLKAYYDEVFAP